MDMGAYVLIINAEKVAVTGKKYYQKLYRRHPTPQPGTLKTETFRDLQQVLSTFSYTLVLYLLAPSCSDQVAANEHDCSSLTLVSPAEDAA